MHDNEHFVEQLYLIWKTSKTPYLWLQKKRKKKKNIGSNIVVTKTTAWAAAKWLFSRVTKLKMNKKRNNDIQKLWIAR